MIASAAASAERSGLVTCGLYIAGFITVALYGWRMETRLLRAAERARTGIAAGPGSLDGTRPYDHEEDGL